MLALKEQLPTAMEALGVLVNTMGIRPALESRVSSGTLKTAFRGERVSRKTFVEIAAVLVDTVFPNSLVEAELGRPDVVLEWKKELQEAVLQLLDSWDEARALVSAAARRVSGVDHAVLPWARLVGIDLGVRWGCWMLARGAKLPSQAWLQAFIEGNGFAATVQGLRDEAAVTIEQLADDLDRPSKRGGSGLARETLEAWLYEGVMPQFDKLERLSQALAKGWARRRPTTSEAELERHLWMRLLWSRASAGLHRAIRESFGDRGIGIARDLALGVAFMARFVHSYVGANAPPDSMPFLWLHVATGVRGSWAPQILTTAAKNTEHPRNAWDLEHATGPWSMVIARWYRELSEPRETVLAALQAEEGVADTAELLRAAEDLVLAFPKVLKNAERNAALDVAVAAVHAGDSEQSVEFRAVQAQHAADHQTTATCARWLVSRRPTNAKYHLWLGAALGRCGDLERGIQECRIADQLVDGGWLLAAAEVGILLLEAERPYDAVMAFEECSTRVHAEQDGAVAVHVLYHHAEALLRTGRTLDAVALLRRARALESRHAPTAERLAHALLLIGEHREGLAMAKEAAHLGLRDILAAFERGEYGRSPGGAQTH